jgi:hypothetical protein
MGGGSSHPTGGSGTSGGGGTHTAPPANNASNTSTGHTSSGASHWWSNIFGGGHDSDANNAKAPATPNSAAAKENSGTTNVARGLDLAPAPVGYGTASRASGQPFNAGAIAWAGPKASANATESVRAMNAISVNHGSTAYSGAGGAAMSRTILTNPRTVATPHSFVVQPRANFATSVVQPRGRIRTFPIVISPFPFFYSPFAFYGGPGCFYGFYPGFCNGFWFGAGLGYGFGYGFGYGGYSYPYYGMYGSGCDPTYGPCNGYGYDNGSGYSGGDYTISANGNSDNSDNSGEPQENPPSTYVPAPDQSANGGATAATEAQPFVLYMKDGSSYAVTDYWLGGGRLHYVTTYGGENTVDLSRLDVQKTVNENAALGHSFSLRAGPASAKPQNQEAAPAAQPAPPVNPQVQPESPQPQPDTPAAPQP